MALAFKRLDRNAIRKLQPGEKISEHGITAECLRNGDVRYSVNVMVDGQRIHRVVGRQSEGVTRTQAEELIEKLRTDARNDRLDLPQGRKVHRLFRDAAEDYLTRLESTDGKDMGNKERHLRSYLVPFLGGERLDKITEFRLRQYRKHRRDQGAAEATINRELATLSHMINRAASKDWGWIKPTDKPPVPKAKEQRKKIRILTPEQSEALLQAAVADQDPRMWLFIMFGLNAGMRHSEIMARRYDEIDFDHCRIWINKAKAGEREQPITPSLRDALARQRKMEADPEGWIFPATRQDCKQPHRTEMRGGFARVVIRAGLDPKQCTPHVMRHTAITRLVKAKVDLLTIKRISGHKTTAMVEYYTHIHGDHIDTAIAALDTAVPDTITPELHTPASGPQSGGASLGAKKPRENRCLVSGGQG
jgi:integrase